MDSNLDLLLDVGQCLWTFILKLSCFINNNSRLIGPDCNNTVTDHDCILLVMTRTWEVETWYWSLLQGLILHWILALAPRPDYLAQWHPTFSPRGPIGSVLSIGCLDQAGGPDLLHGAGMAGAWSSHMVGRGVAWAWSNHTEGGVVIWIWLGHVGSRCFGCARVGRLARVWSGPQGLRTW